MASECLLYWKCWGRERLKIKEGKFGSLISSNLPLSLSSFYLSLSSFAEVPQCRVPIASRSGVISNMIAAMLSKTYTHTCARSGMCALLCLSFSPETHRYLCEDSLLNRIIEICNRIDRVNDGTGLNEKTVNKTLVE